ncbi:hypothetical protein Q9189_006502 [Teloschistes chrysophthalmus]
MVGTGFNNLPAEIRNMIYDFAKPDVAVLSLIGARPVIRERQGVNVWKYSTKSLTLLQLDRRSRTEATALLYEKCTFAISLRHDQSLGFALLGNPIVESIQERGPILAVHKIRNWTIELKWDIGAMGESQTLAFRGLLMRVADLLAHNRRTDSLELHCCCLCSIQEFGRGPRKLRKLIRARAEEVLDFVLEPLKHLPAIKNAVFVPIKSVGRQDWHTGHCEERCQNETCHADLGVITERLKRFLEEGRRPKAV